MIALIPARSGSKGIPDKNIYPIIEYPLLSYTIAACKLSEYISDVYVSTDSEEYAKIAKKYGAIVPFIRPKELALDNSTDFEVLEHFFNNVNDKEICFLRPTTPIRDPKVLDECVRYYYCCGSEGITGMRSAHEINEGPYKLFKIEDGIYQGFFNDFNGIKNYTNLPRQTFPKAYQPNGYIDIVKRYTIDCGSDFGNRILPCVTEYIEDIDKIEQIEKVINIIKENKDYGLYNYLKNNFK